MPSHRTPRPTRGQPLYLGQRPRPGPVGSAGVNNLGRPPTPTPPHPGAHIVTQPMIRAHNLGVPVENRSGPMALAPEVTERNSVWDWPVGAYRIHTSTVEGAGYGRRYFQVMLPAQPGVEKSYASLPIYLASEGKPTPPEGSKQGELRFASWLWNGSVERPTLTPSIRHADITSDHYWHGYVTDGRLVGCANERKPLA